MSIKIILVDDHTIVRSGIRSILEKHHDMEVIGEASDGRAAIKLVMRLSPDVVVIDVSMPNLNGIEATRQIISVSPHTKVVALSMHSEKQFVTGMLEAGAKGYLLKGCSVEELANAISAVTANKAYLSPGISHIVVDGFVHRSSSPVTAVSSSTLSPREREVLQLLAEGNSSKDIALRLNVSVKTVDTHRYRIMKKLDIHTVAELTKYAVREGLTSL